MSVKVRSGNRPRVLPILYLALAFVVGFSGCDRLKPPVQAALPPPPKGVIIPDGKGLVWLQMVEADNTPLPENQDLKKFEIRYMTEQGGLWFVDSDADPEVVLQQGLLSPEEPLFLDPGSYKLHVIGYVRDVPILRGETNLFQLEPAKEETIPIEVRPVANGGSGVFSWSIQIPGSTPNAGLKLYSVENIDEPVAVLVFKKEGENNGWLGEQLVPDTFFIQQDGVKKGSSLVYSGYAEVPPGDYFLLVVLENNGRLLSRNEFVSVFSDMEAPVTLAYDANTFVRIKILSGTADLRLNSEPIQPYIVMVSGADPVTINDQDRVTPSFPITGAKWERLVQAEPGAVIQFVGISAIGGAPFFRSLYTLTIDENDYTSGIELKDSMQVLDINGSAQAAYSGADEMNFYYINIQVYEDPEYRILVNQVGLNGDGTWSMSLLEQETYYFRLQADMGNETETLKLEKDLQGRAVNGFINLGTVTFEGKRPAVPQPAPLQTAPVQVQAAAVPASAPSQAAPAPAPAPVQAAVPVPAPPPPAPEPPPEPAVPVVLDSSRDPQEVLDTLFTAQYLEGGCLVMFDEGYDPSFFEAIRWDIDGGGLGDYAPVIDEEGNPVQDEWGYDTFTFTPYEDPAIFLDYTAMESGSAHEITITVTCNGQDYSRTWEITVP
ncbi:MAG: hypothetical protein LBC62_10705 [Treponema sp.]|jgi:hypothetical protein|nr:hypothetical protein [Treponema sp.]